MDEKLHAMIRPHPPLPFPNLRHQNHLEVDPVRIDAIIHAVVWLDPVSVHITWIGLMRKRYQKGTVKPVKGKWIARWRENGSVRALLLYDIAEEARDAEHLNHLRLDITELTERADNAIKFLSDMFYARAYRLAAVKVGAGDYRSLVDQKLRTAGELYEFMVNEFREARGFILELLVIVILIIEIIPIFRGK
jgi:hypothetical protein